MPSDILHWLKVGGRRMRAFLRPRAIERETAVEFAAHLDTEVEYLVRTEGLSPEEARRRAQVAFGGVQRFREEAREARGFPVIDNLIRDLRSSARGLVRRPSYALMSVATLGVGIGGAATVFAVLNAVVLRPLPFPDSDRLVAVSLRAPGIGIERTGLSPGANLHFRALSTSFDGIAAYSESVGSLSDDGPVSEIVPYAWIGPELLQVLRVAPELGRAFVDEDMDPYRATPGRDNRTWKIPALITYSLWQERFGGDPEIIGREVRIGTSPREIIGVLPEAFAFPSAATRMLLLAPPVGHLSRDVSSGFSEGAVARLRPGISSAEGETELTGLIASMEGEYPDATGARMMEVRLAPELRPLKDEVVGDAAMAVWALFAGVGFLLLVACSNVTNLALLRSQQRSREVAVRVAIGARGGQVLRLFFSEAALVAVLSAALGAMLALWGVSIVASTLPQDFPRLADVRADRWVAAFASGVAILATLGTGLASTALHRGKGSAAILGTSRAGLGGARAPRQALLVAQLALSLVLVAGSGLVVATVDRLNGIDRGFAYENRLAVEIAIPGRRSADYEQIYYGLTDEIAALPGVQGAAIITSVPLSGEGGYASVPIRPADVPARPGEMSQPVTMQFFTPGYFQLMGTAVIEGSGIASRDPADLPSEVDFPHPVLLSRELAARLFPAANAIGQRLFRLEDDGSIAQGVLPGTRTIADNPPYTVAGIVADVRDASMRESPAEVVYVPILPTRVEPSFVPVNATLVVRTTNAPEGIIASVKRRIGESEPDVSVGRIEAMDRIVDHATARERFLAGMLSVAAFVAMFIGGVGVYGTVTTDMRERIQEFALRVALGARPGQVSWLGLRQSLPAVAGGVALGLLGALAFTGFVRSILFEVSPTDPSILAASVAMVVIVAALATGIPARRAARLNPMAALRND